MTNGFVDAFAETWFHTNGLFKIFDSCKGVLSGRRQLFATENLFKMMKNTFYFTLKALLVFKIFKFLSWVFGHAEKQLDYKDKVNFKLYDVRTWETNKYNISRSKSNRTINFSQWIEYNMTNIFLEISYKKYLGETIPRSFSKK